MRHLLVVLAVLAFAATDAEAGKRKRRRKAAAAALETGQTCKLTRPLKAFTKNKGKTLNFKKGATVTLVKVGKKWVTVRSDDDVEGSVKLNKAFKKACKPTAAAAESELEPAEAEATEPPPPEVEPEPEPETTADLPPMPETDVSAHEGGQMELPGSDGPRDGGSVGIDIPVSRPEKVEPYDALDVLGANGAGTFAVERRSKRMTTRDWLGYGGLAVGGVGVVTCGVLIGISSSKAGELAEDIEIYNARTVRSTREANELEDRKRTIAALDITAIAAGALGVAAAAAGGYLLLFAGDESVAWIAPSASDHAVGVVIGGGF